MIGYYAHHRGAGHVHRAVEISARLDEPVTILSSTPPPAGYSGDWVLLPLDHGPGDSDPRSDATAGGALHWAPLRSRGLAARMSAISAWIDSASPAAMVVDVSVEVALLARLHGVPVITMAQPGDRSDAVHTLGYRASSAVIAAWPASLDPLTVAADVAPRVERIGTISRLPQRVSTIGTLRDASAVSQRRGAAGAQHADTAGTQHATAAGTVLDTAPERLPNTIAVLGGFGDRGASRLAELVDSARDALPGYHWTLLRDVDEEAVATALRTSTLVFAHCGQNAIAEIAASRIPAVFIAEDRPHDEQRSMARALAQSSAPVRVLERAPRNWDRVVSAVAAMDVGGWDEWSDGLAVDRAAAIIRRVADGGSGGGIDGGIA